MSNQERRLLRRMQGRAGMGTTPGGLYLPQGAYTPQDEQDAKRDRLAERLLEIVAETATWDNSEELAGEVKGDLVAMAEAALAAAEVIYPELPAGKEITAQTGHLPSAAQQGAESVGGWPAEVHAVQALGGGRGEG